MSIKSLKKASAIQPYTSARFSNRPGLVRVRVKVKEASLPTHESQEKK